MYIMSAINNRRSIRNYTEQTVPKEAIDTLLQAAVQAPSAMNSQPWAFAVLQDAAQLQELSQQAKTHLLSVMDDYPSLQKYQPALANPEFNIFYNASTLLLVLARSEGYHTNEDCCLAAQNIMLVAHSLGLGTCWIGFARPYLNLPATKDALGIPPEFKVIAPLIVGYPKRFVPPVNKKPPQVLFWK